LNLSENLTNSFDYAKKLIKNVGNWILLIILNIIPIVNFIVIGYMGKVLEVSPDSNEPPKLENYGNLWIQGLKIAILSFIYMIVPVILFLIGLSLGLSNLLIPMGISKFRFGTGLILMLAAIIIAFFIAIVYAMGLAHMIKNKSFAKGFAFNEIINIIKAVGFGKYILWLISIFIIGVILAGVSSIPYIGWLISIVVSPLYMVFIGRTIGLIYFEGASKIGLLQPSTAIKQVKYCIQCGAEIPMEAAYCPKCGAAQEAI